MEVVSAGSCLLWLQHHKARHLWSNSSLFPLLLPSLHPSLPLFLFSLPFLFFPPSLSPSLPFFLETTPGEPEHHGVLPHDPADDHRLSIITCRVTKFITQSTAAIQRRRQSMSPSTTSLVIVFSYYLVNWGSGVFPGPMSFSGLLPPHSVLSV